MSVIGRAGSGIDLSCSEECNGHSGFIEPGKEVRGLRKEWERS